MSFTPAKIYKASDKLLRGGAVLIVENLSAVRTLAKSEAEQTQGFSIGSS